MHEKNLNHFTGHYERPFGYLSTKLRKLHPSQRKKGAKTWSNLISSNVQALKDKYNRKISSADEEEDRVIVMDGGGKKKEDKRDKYFSSSSTTDESPSQDETARSKIR